MRLLALVLVAALVSVSAASLLTSRAGSATAIEVVSQNAANRFPDGIQFSVFLSSDSDIQDVRLRFRILPDGVNATARPQCTTGRSVNCNATVGSTAQNYMVPGAKIVYSWEASDAGGARVQSAEQTVSYDDDRFRWDSINEGNLTVFFYFGDLESQRNVLRVAQETIGRMSDLLNTQVDFPINIWVYRTAQEMQPAVASRRGQGPDTSVQTLGEVGASDTALVSRDTDFLNIVRHELAHIVTRAGTRSHIVEIPVWINEGLSTYSQRELLPNEEQALRLAIQRNRVLPITSLGTSARGSSGDVSLFYGQSGSLVAFLIQSQGDDKFGELIAALARDTVDNALKAVYGYDLLGLENEWRRSVGLPPASTSGPGPGSNPQEQPTLVPFGSGQQPTPEGGRSSSASSSDSDGGGTSTGTILAVVAAVAGLAALGGGGFYLWKRRQPGA
jgi:LPXTG-motif cell wall-anchored protein